jgi:hypothetical protein
MAHPPSREGLHPGGERDDSTQTKQALFLLGIGDSLEG